MQLQPRGVRRRHQCGGRAERLVRAARDDERLGRADGLRVARDAGEACRGDEVGVGTRIAGEHPVVRGAGVLDQLHAP